MNEPALLLVPALGHALLDFVWQGALIGALAWLALALLRHAPPQARYAVACLAMLACMLAPVATLFRLLGRPEASIPPGGNDGVAGHVFHPMPAMQAPVTATDVVGMMHLPVESMLPWVVAAWSIGAALLALRMATGMIWVRRLRATALPGDDGTWQARLDALAARFGIRRHVAWCLLPDGASPLSAGWWRPVVMVPAALVMRMPTPLLEALVAHELAHVRRHDYLVNLLQGAVEVLLFYHPVTWWLSRRIRIEREQVADDLAARVLGEPRRLAVALSELDRTRVAFPTLAQAAHGGQLMSRIQQLVRPDRRPAGTLVALPLIGLALAGLAIAHAGGTAPPAAAIQASVAVPAAPVATPPSSAVAVTAPPTALTPPAPAATASPPRDTARVATADDRRDGYAIVRGDSDRIPMTGDIGDRAAIHAAQGAIDGDFLWVRRDGKAYVVRDPQVLARTEATWKALEPLDAKMQALDQRMKPHSERMEELGARMEALADADGGVDHAAMDAIGGKMQALGQQQQAIGMRQAQLGMQMASADPARRAALERDMDELERQQAGLGRRMEVQQREMETHTRQLEARVAPMEALGREMEAAGKPMEAIGKEMEAVGKEIEAAAARADAQARRIIDDAFARGLATPAPGAR